MKYNGISFNPKSVAAKGLSEFIQKGLLRYWKNKPVGARTADLKRVYELCVKEHGNDIGNAEQISGAQP